MNRCRLWIGLGGLLLAGCAIQERPIEPGVGAPVVDEEEGLWLISEKSEQSVAISGLRLRDEPLNAYVNQVTCRVAGPYCPDIRGYVLQLPDFNAAMAPNGFMQVWTGLLLRVENEAQLAAVLGHESVHYLERHSLERLKTTQRTANLLLAAQMGMSLGGAAGAVPVNLGSIGSLIATGYLADYSRDQEREADDGGFGRMVDVGYAPEEAAAIWKNLMAEQDACDLPTPPALLASHPPSSERLETLRRMAEASGVKGETGRERFLAATLPHRGEWLRMALQQRQLCRTRVVIERLLEQEVNPGELHYYLGEVYRLRDEDGDLDKAIEAYNQALEYPDAPVTVHRDLGLALWRTDRQDAARAAFERYLEKAGDADDASMVHAYLEQL